MAPMRVSGVRDRRAAANGAAYRGGKPAHGASAHTVPPRPRPARSEESTKLALARAAARQEENERLIASVMESLALAQGDLRKLRGGLPGVGELRRELGGLLLEATGAAERMSRATRKDLQRLRRGIDAERRTAAVTASSSGDLTAGPSSA